MSNTNEQKVLQAVKDMLEGSEGHLFQQYVSAFDVAEEVGISTSTARKYLEYHVGVKRLTRARIGGTFGYRPRVWA